MRVLIDFTQIPRKKTGVGIYAINLIHEISKRKPACDYYITVQDDDLEFDLLNNSDIKVIKINNKIFRRLIFRFIFEQVILPIIALYHRIDLVHSLHYSFPIACSFTKRIVTFHDLTFFKYPQLHLKDKRIYFKFFISIAHLIVDKIIVVSESTKKDLTTFTATKSDIISVIYLGCKDLARNISQKEICEIKRKYCLPEKYILFLGVIEPRKNIANLIRAFYSFQRDHKDFSLVIAGKKGWHYNNVFHLAKQYNLDKQIIFLGYVDENDKDILIKGSKIFVYPSVYEGFGLPVLEAMNLGIPTIASDGSSINEFAKGGALLVDTKDPKQIFDALKALVYDRRLYIEISEKSKLLSKKFTWENTAEQTIEEYLSILLSGKR
jgi:glycosyltransferase involved in cell wall biosynthesis